MPHQSQRIQDAGREAWPCLDAADVFLNEEKRIRAFMRKLGVATQDAEDVEHQVLLIIVERGPMFQKNAQVSEKRAVPSTLLYALCRNCASKYRRQSRAPRNLIPEEALELVGHIPTPDENLVASEETRRCSLALSRLAPRYRRVLEMLDMDRRDSSEVAEEMGLSMGALRVLHHRAREELRLEIEKLSR